VSPARRPAGDTEFRRQLTAALDVLRGHPQLTAYELSQLIPSVAAAPAALPADGGLGLDLGAPPAPAFVSTGRALALMQELERTGLARHVLSGHDIPRWLWEATGPSGKDDRL